ncbi:hypothetical protein JXJ21_03010 [candidate division KSB1 bacterium]|nr:hypothetical protein [candidate division KSB1 bacterium]
MQRHLPLKHPTPDAGDFIDILMGRAKSARVPLVEYIVDYFLMQPIVENLLDRQWVTAIKDRQNFAAHLNNFIEFWYRMGYDFVRFESGMGFSNHRLVADDPAPNSRQRREWVDSKHGTITNWDEFESYPWPQIESVDFFPFEYISKNLPEGMGFMTCHAGGILEHLSAIMSYEGLSLALYDNPELVQAVVDRIGGLMTAFYRHLVDLEHVIAIFQGDDMGFRTATLISPDDMRKYVLPWHKKLAAITHAKGLPYFLHSCGNVNAIMQNLINDVGIDGKHSFEDAIIPVQDFQQRYGQSIAVLGGIDLNILSDVEPERVRKKTRELIEGCGRLGRYAVGSGNSVPSYVPLENYLAMIDEAIDCMQRTA